MLTAGTRVGPYEIVSWLGAGGMGEVYRARDTKLDREVALKTLPEELACQPERLARLRQEARILASLNHPGIATLHGLEESDGGVPVLVMELVEGESLADRLRRGRLPLREAVTVAHQIALALEAAHDRGVLHRDLKPANIRLAPDGRVKMLDFGLAKAVRKAAVDSRLDTETSPRSEAGALLGTAPYMSPEQARGQEADRRSDVWAFGCVLYEMLAGKRAFDGASFSDTVAAILDREPDWSALPPETPAAVTRLLRRCLQKEKDRRLRDIGDARLELEELLAEPASTGGGANDTEVIAPRRVTGRGVFGSRLVWVVVGITAIAAGLWALRTFKPVVERPVVRFVITLPERVGGMAWSPDGAHLAYTSWRGEGHQIYVHTLDRPEETAIPGTEDGGGPIYSPDGRWMAFWAHGLKKIPVAGGPPLAVCDCTVGNRGASWGPDGTIVFAPQNPGGLVRVSAEGGTPQVLTTLDPSRHENSHRFPEVLPGGEAVVFTVKPPEALSWDEARIEAVSLRTGERSILFTGGTTARYVAPGYLVYHRRGSLWAAPFDAARLKVTGPPVRVLEGVSSSDNGSADFQISRDGSLAYLAGKTRGLGRRLVRVDRAGRRRPVTDLHLGFSSLRLSPDGRRLALQVVGPNDQIRVYDLERGTLTSLTHGWNNTGPIWTPDGRRLVFSSDRDGSRRNLFWQPADGSGPAERLGNGEPMSWSPDGKDLVYLDGAELRILALGGDRQSRPLLPGIDAAVSPNGRWLAYDSEESGRREVYVTSFPKPAGRWTISTDGGEEPLWARNGRELYYWSASFRLMAVTVTSDSTFSASKPRALFQDAPIPNISWSYDVTRDGEFLMLEGGESELPPSQINVVLNWAQELKQRVGAR